MEQGPVLEWLKRRWQGEARSAEPDARGSRAALDDYCRFIVGRPSLLAEEKELPHPKPLLVETLRREVGAALGRRDFKRYDRLKEAWIMLCNFQDGDGCRARGQAPETVMISEVRLLLTELDDMAAGLGPAPPKAQG
jgi:hypothetical protein